MSVPAILNTKGGAYAAAIVALGIVLYFVFKKKKTAEEKAEEIAAQAQAISENNYINQLKRQYTQTYPDHKYIEFADSLEGAMSGLGTTWSIVERVFKGIKNPLDLELLNVSFGIRDKQNLVQWLIDDLSEGEIEDLQEILKPTGAQLSMFEAG